MPVYSKKISSQLEDFIKIPTVLVTKQDEPYEFKETGSSKRFRCRRYLPKDKQIPIELFNLIINQDVPITKLMEFSSGIFLNYVSQRSTYL